MKMKALLLILISFLLTGCWNYTGLNEMTIVAGVAIDRNAENDNYKLTFEVVDLQASSQANTLKPKIIEATGKTIFEAVRNAKKRITNKLHFSNAQVLVISEEIAKKDGITSITNWFLRDAEMRETMNLVISKEKTAKELLTKDSTTLKVVSFEIQKIVDIDQNITASSKGVMLYTAYNTLKSEGLALVLPAFKLTKNDKDNVPEIDGLAIFKGDKLAGYLSSNDSKYFLFATNAIKGGVVPITTDADVKKKEKNNVSLEISGNSTDTAFTYKKKKVKITIKTQTKTFLDELRYQKTALMTDDIEKIQKQAGKTLSKRIEDVISKVQKEYGVDIFGFGNSIYKKNPKLWKKLKKDWNKTFKELKVEVDSDVKIANTAFVK